MKVVFDDNSWFIGNRTIRCKLKESKGTHHFIVINGDEVFKPHIGKEVAVVIIKPKYFIMEKKNK